MLLIKDTIKNRHHVSWWNYFGPVFSVCLILLLQACSGDDKEDTSLNRHFVGGSITVKPQMSLDGDVIERNSPFSESNNDLTTAQVITNPISIGGYLSGQEIEYQEDEVIFSQDRDDVYSVSLLALQTISISAYHADDDSSANQINLRMELLRTNNEGDIEIVESAELFEAGASTLIVPAIGEYYIRLSLSDQSSPVLYVMSLSDNLSIDEAKLLEQAINDEFVPGEILVAPRQLSDSSLRSSRTYPKLQGLQLKESVGKIARLYKIDEGSSSLLNGSRSFRAHKARSTIEKKWQTLNAIKTLSNENPAYYFEPNYVRKAVSLPNDAYYEEQWNLDMISAHSAWDITTGSDEVLVAILDTGIDVDHEDLMGKISPFSFDFVSDSTLAGDGDGIDEDPQDLSTTRHGSHVAGIVGAATNNEVGIASVGHRTSLLALRVLGVENDDGDSTGNDADIAEAIYYAAGLSNDSGMQLAKPVDVINLSLGGAAESTTLKNAINAALAEGVVVVAASGNDGLAQAFYPAAYEGVIAVGSVTSQGERSSFSNYGSYLDVVAPGGATSDQDFNVGEQGILSTVRDSNYASYAGTSMAAPHVSGVVALVRAVNRNIGSASILSALQGGVITDQIGKPEFFGGGLINAEKAVKWAADPNSILDELAVFPRQMSFANENTNAPLYLSNSGPGLLDIKSISADQDWIEVVEIELNEEGLGEYEVRVDSNKINVLASGSIEIVYSINAGSNLSISVPVIASRTVLSTQTVGNLFVSLYSEEALDEAVTSGILYSDYIVSASLSDGVYSYNFPSVLNGSYYVRASTNNDGDRYLFDKGEAVGRYPNLSKFELIEVNNDMDDVDFEVQFLEQNISSQKNLENSRVLLEKIRQ